MNFVTTLPNAIVNGLYGTLMLCLLKQAICNFYGSTEVMGDVTYLKFNNFEEAKVKLVNNKVPIGKCHYLLSAVPHIDYYRG